MQEYKIKNTNYILRYHDLPGEKATILFIHGLGCAGSFDYPQVASQPKICEHRRILVDLLGFGFSDKPLEFSYTVRAHAKYLLEFIDHLGLDKIILFGHSLGGAIALSLADQCREKLISVILSEANLEKSIPGSVSIKVASYSEEYFIEEGYKNLILRSLENNNTQWAASLSISSPIAISRISNAAVEGVSPSWKEILFSLECSKTFIYGEKTTPKKDIEELKKRNIRIEIVNDAGHSMAWENPKGLASAIQNGISVQ